MRKGRFGIGIVAGLVFALALVGASSVLNAGFPASGSQAPLVAGGSSQNSPGASTSTQVSSAATSTTSAGASPPPPQGAFALGNTTSTATNSQTQTHTGVSNGTGSAVDMANVAAFGPSKEASPSNLANITSQPTGSFIVLVPLFAALLLGLVFFRATSVKE